MADNVDDDTTRAVRSVSLEETAPSSPPPIATTAANEASSPLTSTDLEIDEDDDSEGADPLLADQVLAVVVTSVDAALSAPSGVVSAASSKLLLRSVHEEHVVELVVTRRGGSHCVRRSLAALVAVLQPLAPPEFPMRQRGDDALIATWCGDMTRFLAGAGD